MHLAQNLKYLREQRSVNQNELAEILGVVQATIGNWEAGRREPELSMIVQLAEYFNVTLDDLVLKDLRPSVSVYVSNLRYLRTKYKMTQEDMANLLQCKGKQGYNAVENGKVKASVDDLEKLADFFGVTLDQMVKQDLSREDA